MWKNRCSFPERKEVHKLHKYVTLNNYFIFQHKW